MSQYTSLTLAIDEGLARLTLSRPDDGNAFSDVFFREFGEAVNELALRRDEVRAVLLASTGRFFSVGGDIALFARDLDEVPSAVLDGTNWMHPGLARLARLDAPVVAAVQGTAMGGAVAMISNSDLVISARSARFGAAYSRLGLSCDLGATFGLASRMGIARARRFLLLAETLDAEQALRAGLVDEVVDDELLAETAERMAVQLSHGPTRAYGEVRRLVARALGTPFETQLEDEAQGLTRAAGTADAREGITAFLEKRAPVFRGV